MKSYRCYGMCKQYYVSNKNWVSTEKFIGNIDDIEMVSMSYYDYDENMEIVGSGYEDLSVDRFKVISKHVYEIEKDGVANGTLEFYCNKKDFAALSKFFKEHYFKLGSILKSKRADNYIECELKNILIKQYWNGRIDIKLRDFIAEVIRINGYLVLKVILELIAEDLKSLNIIYKCIKNKVIYFECKDKTVYLNFNDLINNCNKFITLRDVNKIG